MKKYNLALIITGGTLVGSLLLGGRNYTVGTSGSATPSIAKNEAKILSAYKVRSSMPHYFGIITQVDSKGLKVDGTASSPNEYTVLTSDATVYMRNNNLDSLEDLSPGQTIVVMGQLDARSKIIHAAAIQAINS